MRVMINISYEGTQFEGFAPQPHGRTVSNSLMRTLAKIYKQEIKIHGSSRTDSNVSARCQYIVYDQPFIIEPASIVRALNCNLEDGIYCISAEEVDSNFQPRYEVKNKTYTYTITQKYDLFNRNHEYYIHTKLDYKAMDDACKYLVGTHDFSSFCSSNTDVQSKVRTINSLSTRQEGDRIIIEINGDGFLYNMVRIIAGTLIVIGLGKDKPESMETILNAEDRSCAYSTAPAHGLMLEKIYLKGRDGK